MSSVKELLESASGNQMYLLMNKDRPIYKFRFIDDNSIQVLDIYEKPPFWIKDLEDWLRARNAAKHRNDIQKILIENNAMTIKGFALFTRCLSLTDTLWVKQESDKTLWSSVSLYSNNFRESLGIVLTDSGFGDTSDPTLSTDGSFPKCWTRRNGVPCLVKEGKTGYEPFAEAFSSAFRLSNVDVVRYSVEQRRFLPATVCECFTTEDISFIPHAEASGSLCLNEVAAYYDALGCKKGFFDMLLLDAVSINTDRHSRNYGIMLDSNTYEKLGISPVFDMNYAYKYDSLYDIKRPIDELLDVCVSKRFGGFIESISGNIDVNSVYGIEESIEELKTTGIPLCEEWLFQRMVDISQIQLEKIKKIL